MNPYIPNTSDDEEKMLKSIGLNSLEELFSDIPNEIRLKRKLNLNNAMSEIEVTRHIKNIALKNKNTEDLVCFLGAGAYDRYIPSVIKHITSRSEFYTAYTPYQAEISQGTLQTIFEYQSMICNLTGMEVSNASMYDGATACAEAAFMACEVSKRKSIVVSSTVHPEVRKVLKTYTYFRGIELIEVDDCDGVTDIEKLKSVVTPSTAGVIVQSPNFFGIIEDVSEIEDIIHKNKGLLIMGVDPVALSILKSPGEAGADIAYGEAQSIGNSLSFGGPYIGFMATTPKLMRKLPGRIVGQSDDAEGKRAFVLTLQAREQHIRRQRASSNICSNEALNALASVVYLTAMGKKGLKEVAYQSLQKAHYAHKELIKSGNYTDMFKKPFFMEFAIKSSTNIDTINSKLLEKNILGGFNIEMEYSKYKNTMLLCVTEKRTKEEIDNLVSSMEVIK